MYQNAVALSMPRRLSFNYGYRPINAELIIFYIDIKLDGEIICTYRAWDQAAMNL